MYGQGNCYRKSKNNLDGVHDPRIGPAKSKRGDLFCGPITVEEFKWSMERDGGRLEKQVDAFLEKQSRKKTGKETLKALSIVKENKENIPESIVPEVKKHTPCQALTVNNLSQLAVPNNLNDSHNSSNTSNRTYTLENSDQQITSPGNALNSTYDKLQEIVGNDVPEEAPKNINPVNTLKPSNFTNLQSYRQNPHDTVGSEISLNIENMVEHSVLEASSNVNQTNKTILASFDNLKLDDVCGSLTDISMKSYTDSPLAKALLHEKSLTEMVTDYLSPSVDTSRIVNRSIRTSNQFNCQRRTTPGKMSTTLITELKAEHCLIDSFRDSTGSTKNRSTPDVFRQIDNDMWKPKSNVTAKSQTPGKSKIPLKKTPSKYHAIQSPVRGYIHNGISVQSMSKARHASCSKDLSMIRSKSESKIQSKIPQLSHNVKKKLELPKMSKAVSSTSFISRRSTFRN